MAKKTVSSLSEKQYVTTNDGIQLALSPEEYEEMKILQKYILEIMVVVDEFCRNNDITYYLGEGTLLGAVRNNGFIPWDDDADILMPRKDYDKFLKLASDGLKEGYQLDCVATNPKHWSIISNVQLVRKTKFEKKENYKNNALNCGPCIDVFPLDYIPKANGLKLKIRGKFIRILRRTLWIKSGIHNRSSYTTVWKRIFYYCSGKIISFLFSIKGLHNKLNKLMLKTNDENNKYLINFGSLYDFSKEIYDKDLFGTPIEMEFEGHKFYVPSKPTKILETLYDDYTVLPPVEKRRSMHHFKNFE